MKAEPSNLTQLLSRIFGTRGGLFQEVPHISEVDELHEFAVVVSDPFRNKKRPKDLPKFVADWSAKETTKVGKKTYKTESVGIRGRTVEIKGDTATNKTMVGKPGGHMRYTNVKTKSRRVRKHLPDFPRKTTRTGYWDVSRGTAGKKPKFDKALPVDWALGPNRDWVAKKTRKHSDDIHQFVSMGYGPWDKADPRYSGSTRMERDEVKRDLLANKGRAGKMYRKNLKKWKKKGITQPQNEPPKNWKKTEAYKKSLSLHSESDDIHQYSLTGLALGLGAAGAFKAGSLGAKALMASPSKNPITLLGAFIIGKKLWDATLARILPQKGPGQLELKTADNKRVQVWAVDAAGVQQEVDRSMPGWQVIQKGLAAGVAGGTEGLISGAAKALMTENNYNYHESDSDGEILPEHLHDIHGNPVLVSTPKVTKAKRAAKIGKAVAGVAGGMILGGIVAAGQRTIADLLHPNVQKVKFEWGDKPANVISGVGRTIHSEADELFRYKELINA